MNQLNHCRLQILGRNLYIANIYKYMGIWEGGMESNGLIYVCYLKRKICLNDKLND